MKNIQGLQVLEESDIRRFAPSFYAKAPKSDVSEQYAFINTRDVAVTLWKEGWMPTFARESRSIDPSNRGFQKHMIRFSHPNFSAGGERIQLALVNSHNRASCIDFWSAVYRLVCSNGMIAKTGDMGAFKIRHVGSIEDQVHEGVRMITEQSSLVAESIDAFKSIELTRNEQGTYASAVHEYMYGDANHVPVEASQLLIPRRSADRAPTLWNTFNTVQENVIKGGVRGRNAKGRRFKTRAIKSIDNDVKLNKAMWTLADSMAKLKTTGAEFAPVEHI